MMNRIVILIFVCLVTAQSADFDWKLPAILSVWTNNGLGQHSITRLENYQVDIEHRPKEVGVDDWMVDQILIYLRQNSNRLILVRRLEDRSARFLFKNNSILYKTSCLHVDSGSYLAVLKNRTGECATQTQISLIRTESESDQQYAKFIVKLSYNRYILCPIIVDSGEVNSAQESTSFSHKPNYYPSYYIKFLNSGKESESCGNHRFKSGLTLLLNNSPHDKPKRGQSGFNSKHRLTTTHQTDDSVNVQSTTDMDGIHTRVGPHPNKRLKSLNSPQAPPKRGISGFNHNHRLTTTHETNNRVHVQSTTEMDSIHTPVGLLPDKRLRPFSKQYSVTLYIDPNNVADTKQRFHIRIPTGNGGVRVLLS
jgi:hypothetical protein